MKPILRKIYILILSLFISGVVAAAPKSIVTEQQKTAISQTLTRIVQREVKGVQVKVTSVAIKGGAVRVVTSVGLSYYPVREDNLRAMCDSVRIHLPAKLKTKKVELYSDGREMSQYIPLGYRSSTKRVTPFVNSSEGGQLVRPERPYKITKGLNDRHIALWQSHGRYFDVKANEWRWQRSLLWQTVEDLYTQSYVLPYVVPMLEAAGATVMLPRERDFQTEEIVVDNDGAGYSESEGIERWSRLEEGFAHKKESYLSGENPFKDGSCRVVKTVADGGKPSVAKWSATFDKSGDYAVYVSYKSLPNSLDGALYTIHHAGGQSRVHVNQKIGGGTWIYLGTYHFTPGKDKLAVTLTNVANSNKYVVTADAVKIGGGYGNIARTVCDSLRVEGCDYTPITSGMPRYCEGARYWLQWAGFDKEVYSKHDDCNDYNDDYKCRGEWVNALMGGSERLEKEEGLGIPVDLSLAFHSDAGITDNDATIGTLGIYYTKYKKGKFEDGASRFLSRDLTDLIMSQITNDIRRTYEPEWRRRGMWNRSYFEARVPSTPTMLLELLSHQNLADMRLGHDPNFKFTVSRAIYKAILRHLSVQYGREYCVAPLPINSFATSPAGDGGVRLTWRATVDSLESTAKPTAYIVYTREGDGGFDNGRVVTDNSLIVNQKLDVIYSYRVTAINAGGESFPSETLAVCQSSDAKSTVMIVNGFDRLSAAECREDGFHNEFDSGVAYLRDVAFIGEQRVHDISKRREKSEPRAFGVSFSNHAGKIVGGNSFDYPYLHGKSLKVAGCSFYSSSLAAVESGEVDLSGFNVVDLVLGKQRTTTIGRGVAESKYQCFSDDLQRVISDYLKSNGALFVSGAYIGTDLCGSMTPREVDVQFARDILHISYMGNGGCVTKLDYVTTESRAAERLSSREYSYCREYRPDYYTVNSVDAFAPVGNAKMLMRYPDSNLAAAIGWNGEQGGATFVMGFPFESITDEQNRDFLMREIIEYLIH
ncbi:MAG: xanthan lyase [Alistipes sp.]|nr:xanthan lyase [Alistipes sp.]